MDNKVYFAEISKMIVKHYNVKPLKIKFIGGGFFGRVFLVKIPIFPFNVIVKIMLTQKMLDKEILQIETLSKHSKIKMPQIYAKFKKNNGYSCDAYIMEKVAGKLVGLTLFMTKKQKENIGNAIVDNLLNWHNQLGESFGEIGCLLYPTFKEYYQQNLDNILSLFDEFCIGNIKYEKLKVVLHNIANDFDKLINDDIKPSLCHGDYNTFNIIQKNGNVSAIIDPCGAMYGDFHTDLYQLNNYNGKKLKLLEKYKQRSNSAINEQKIYFYEIFNRLKHYMEYGKINDKKLLNAINNYNKYK